MTKSLIMISSYDTNQCRIFEGHLENAEQNLQSKSLIVEQIAEENNSRTSRRHV